MLVLTNIIDHVNDRSTTCEFFALSMSGSKGKAGAPALKLEHHTAHNHPQSKTLISPSLFLLIKVLLMYTPMKSKLGFHPNHRTRVFITFAMEYSGQRWCFETCGFSSDYDDPTLAASSGSSSKRIPQVSSTIFAHCTPWKK